MIKMKSCSKAIRALALFLMISCNIFVAEAQPIAGNLASYSLEITNNKTTSLVFPVPIQGVDRGSRDVLAQKAKGIENVLQLKAATIGFRETNLTVVTADGRLYHFIVNYTNQPAELTIEVGRREEKPESSKAPVIFSNEINKVDMATYAEAISIQEKSFWTKGKRKHKVSMALQGIYVKDDILYYHLSVKNHSALNYDIGSLRFYVRDNRNVKRTASQELEMKPLHVYGDPEAPVEGGSTVDLVYVLEKFTIPDAKHLSIELFEKNGGRHLDLSLKNRRIVNAKPVPEKEEK